MATNDIAAIARIRAACRLAPTETLADAAVVVETLAAGGSFGSDGRLYHLHHGVLEASKRNGDLRRKFETELANQAAEHGRAVAALRAEIDRLGEELEAQRGKS